MKLNMSIEDFKKKIHTTEVDEIFKDELKKYGYVDRSEKNILKQKQVIDNSNNNNSPKNDSLFRGLPKNKPFNPDKHKNSNYESNEKNYETIGVAA